jgi:hypothetical protein
MASTDEVYALATDVDDTFRYAGVEPLSIAGLVVGSR